MGFEFVKPALNGITQFLVLYPFTMYTFIHLLITLGTCFVSVAQP